MAYQGIETGISGGFGRTGGEPPSPVGADSRHRYQAYRGQEEDVYQEMELYRQHLLRLVRRKLNGHE